MLIYNHSQSSKEKKRSANHGKDFIANMDKYMPDWKDRKNLLNEQILDCYKE